MRRLCVAYLLCVAAVVAAASGCNSSVEAVIVPVTPAHGEMGKPLRVADRDFGFDFVITVTHCYWPVSVQSADLVGAQVELSITNKASTGEWDNMPNSFEIRTKDGSRIGATFDPISGSIAGVPVTAGHTVSGMLYFNSGGLGHEPTLLSLLLNADQAAATWELTTTEPR